MTSSQGTLIQRWNKSCTVFVTVVVTLLHLTAFAVAAYLCPELFTARSYEGAHCQPGHRADTFEVAAADCGAELHEGKSVDDELNGTCVGVDLVEDILDFQEIALIDEKLPREGFDLLLARENELFNILVLLHQD